MRSLHSGHLILWRGFPGWLFAFSSVVLLAFAHGGFFPSSWWPGTVAFTSVAGLALVGQGYGSLTRAQILVVGAFVGLVVWTALSEIWSPVEGASLLEARRTLVYATFVLAAVAVRGRLLEGALAGIAAVCAYALAQRLAVGPPSPPDPFQGTLLQEPIGYANGLGGLAAIGVSATVVLAVSRTGRWLPYGALAIPFAVTLALTGSRAGVLAAVVGSVGGVALALGRVRIAQVVVGFAMAALVCILSLAAGPLASELAARAGDRPWYWHVAWEEVVEAPVVGKGAGTFELAWLERQPVPVTVRDAHSLYLETLAELGLVGLGLLGLALLLPLLVGFRTPGAGAATAGYVAFLLHAGVDWDWELPAVTVAGLLCGAALLSGKTQVPGTRRI